MNPIVDQNKPAQSRAVDTELVGVVFALKIESGALVDRMIQVQTTHGNGFTYHYGMLGWKRFVLVESGIGLKKARNATESLIEVFKPNQILSAGFAGALDPALLRNTVYSPSSVSFQEETIEISEKNGTMLLTCDHLVDTVKEKHEFWERTGAQLVDMETYAVAQIAKQNRIPFFALRIVFDLANEELVREIRNITNPQQSKVRLFGAVAGALFRRPSCVYDLYKYKERALISADRLALEIERIYLEQ